MPSLIINGSGIEANVESERLILRRSGEERPTRNLQVPLHDVERAVVIGHPQVSVRALQKLLRLGVSTAFITEHGSWMGTLHADNDKNAARRVLQYEMELDRSARLLTARSIVRAKIRNSRRVLQRLSSGRRSLHSEKKHQDIQEDLNQYQLKVSRAETFDELRGYEGVAAARYFEQFAGFFPEEFPFNGRNRRPPHDPANALLSFAYTILLSRIEAALRSHGLDPCLGFLHETAHGTPSLALDLLEPLRAPVCDLLALNLLNHSRLRKEHFSKNSEDGGIYLNAGGRQVFFEGFESSMERKFAPVPGAPHTDFHAVIEEQIFAVLERLSNRTRPPERRFFKMP
jgi:CRISPR-associated protein Cas1